MIEQYATTIIHRLFTALSSSLEGSPLWQQAQMSNEHHGRNLAVPEDNMTYHARSLNWMFNSGQVEDMATFLKLQEIVWIPQVSPLMPHFCPANPNPSPSLK